jgi:hypothetical protein
MRYNRPDITPEMRAKFRAADRESDRTFFRGAIFPVLLMGLLTAIIFFAMLYVMPWLMGCRYEETIWRGGPQPQFDCPIPTHRLESP